MTTQKRISELDGLRFLSFLAVFLFHADLFPAGYLGVQFFFLLSAYLLIPVHLKRLHGGTSRAEALKIFWLGRFVRIVPIYLVYLAVAGACLSLRPFSQVFTADAAMFRVALPSLLAFVGNAYGAVTGAHSYFFSHLWSLAVEMHFYFLMPVVLGAMGPGGNRKTLLTSLVLLTLGGPLFRWGTLEVFSRYPDCFHAEPDTLVYLLTPSYVDAFALGGLAALVETKNSKGLFWAAFGLCVSSAAAGLFFHPSRGSAGAFGFPKFYRGTPTQPLWGYSVINFFGGTLLLALRNGHFSWLTRAVSFLGGMGRRSYAMYLFHFPLILCIRGLTGVRNTVAQAVLALCATLVLSALCYELVEKPLATWFRRTVERRN